MATQNIWRLTSLLRVVVLLGGLLFGGGSISAVLAQDPPPPQVEEEAEEPSPSPVGEEVVPVEPLPATPPTDAVPIADTLELPPEVVPDSLASDTVEVREARNLPHMYSPVPAGWQSGIWEWDQELLLSTRALTLIDLLTEVPGIVPLQAGDYGQPASLTAFGLEGGRVRIFLDGIEMPPLDGGVVDLSRVGLGGIGHVRVERRVGELRVDLTPLQFVDPRAYSLLEVGTGDLNTNFFRGTFALPFALGGNLVAFIDRIDTEGTARSEPGVTFGAGVRHTIFLGENGGVVWDLRRMSSKRPSTLWSPTTVQRTDFGIQARHTLFSQVLGTVFYRSSSLKPVGEEESLPPLEVGEDPRRVLGLRLATEAHEIWGEVEVRKLWGERWPTFTQSARGGFPLPLLGGVSFGADRETWDGGETALNFYGRAATSPVFGFSLFAEFETGERGIPGSVPPPPPASDEEEEEEEEEELPLDPWVPSFTDRTGFRAGVEFQKGGWGLGGAFLRVEADSLHPMSFQPDRGDEPMVGGERTGVEASARLPLTRLMRGLAFQGSGQLWEEEGAWRYLPNKMYQARLSYHGLFLETGNLEVWWDLGLRGRNAMLVPASSGGLTPPAEVPFRQSWFARVQVRVVSVRLFLDWENVTGREFNQDFPDRILPQMRIAYGIRWTLWN